MSWTGNQHASVLAYIAAHLDPNPSLSLMLWCLELYLAILNMTMVCHNALHAAAALPYCKKRLADLLPNSVLQSWEDFKDVINDVLPYVSEVYPDLPQKLSTGVYDVSIYLCTSHPRFVHIG